MGMMSEAQSKANALRNTREWKARQRLESDAFLRKEAAARKKYSDFGKLCRLYVKANPYEFAKFLQQHQRGEFNAPSPTAQSHTPPVGQIDYIKLLGVR